MATRQPAVVIVPGAWHVPEHYEPAAKLLRNAGYETVVVRHPSVSVQRDPGNMLRKDSTVAADVMRKLVNDEGKDVVVVMHSYGGVSGSEAAAMLSEWLPAHSIPEAGRIRRLVYLAAHVIEKGVSFQGSGRIIPNVDTSERGMMVHRQPYERYYADTTREHAQPALDRLAPMAQSAMTTPTVYAGWKDYGIPCTYIRCLNDAAVTGDLCDLYIKRLKDSGVDTTVEELDAGHSPFWIGPEELLQVLKRVL